MSPKVVGDEKCWWINWSKFKVVIKGKTKSFLGSDSHKNLLCILKNDLN